MVKKISFDELPSDLPECVACIGFFDSLHRGHQQLICRCREEADTLGLPAALICFDKDPLEVISGKQQLHILSYNERISRIFESGIDRILMFEFDERFMNLDHITFVSDYLNRMPIRKLICGFDFNFGYHGLGNSDTLKQYGSFETIVIPQISFYQLKISSSRIKKEISRGNLRLAERLLGYKYYLDVEVIKTQKNAEKWLIYAKCPDPCKVLPPAGSYLDDSVIIKGDLFQIFSTEKKEPGDTFRLEF